VEPLSLLALAVVGCAVAYGFLRKAPLSLTIGLALLVVYMLEVVSRGRVALDLAIVRILGEMSAPWTWATFQFVHAGIDHLLLNLLALLMISPTFEERIGSVRWALLFFAGGPIGAAAFVAVNASQPLFVLLGASAGVSAVFGAYGRLYPRERIQLFLPLPGVPSFRAIDVVLGFVVLETALSYIGGWFGLGNVAWVAHVVALAFGLAVAPLLLRLPLGRARPVRRLPLRGLEELAVTPELRSILAEAERADLPEIRDAWMEKFVRAARCPRCGGPLRRRLGRLTSDCGWKVRLE